MNKFLMKLMAHGGYMAPQDGDGGAGGGAGGSNTGPEGGEGGGEGGKGGAGAGDGKSGGEGGQGGTGDPAGGKKPTDEEARLIREVMDKKDKLKNATTALEQANARLKEFDGLDPKELRQLVKDKQDAETAKLEAKGQWDALKKQMNDQHEAEIATRDAAVTAAQGEVAELRNQIAELTVGNAFGQSKFIADELTLSVAKARRIYGAHFEFKDGAVVAFDKPAGAKDRSVLVDSKGEPLGFDAALSKLVDGDPDKDTLIKSKLRAGAGSSTNPAAAPGARPGVSAPLTGRAKIAAGLKKAGIK
jgi:hypothetical protein